MSTSPFVDGLSEFVFARTYSRNLPDGTPESWDDCVVRVIGGLVYMWDKFGVNDPQIRELLPEIRARMHNLRFLPPGRGLWAMGTRITNEKGLYAALNNCSFISTKDIEVEKSQPFAFLMDMLMLGVGVGFDVAGADILKLHARTGAPANPANPSDLAKLRGLSEATDKFADIVDVPAKYELYVVNDSREGWVESLRVLLDSFFEPSRAPVLFDYSHIRPRGCDLKIFGGKSSGPEPLAELHAKIALLLMESNTLSLRLITDIMNLIGKCVIAGNVRRSAEIALGPANEEFLNLKNYNVNPERLGWGWCSNNTIIAQVGDDYSKVAERIRENGEPGIFWLDTAREHSRMGERDMRDIKACGTNPCCFVGSTLIKTSQGFIPIQELANLGKNVPVYSCDATGVVVRMGRAPRYVGEGETVKIFLEGAKVPLQTTPEHILYLANGTPIAAGYICAGMHLMRAHPRDFAAVVVHEHPIHLCEVCKKVLKIPTDATPGITAYCSEACRLRTRISPRGAGSIEVLRVEDGGVEKVYNITVERSHVVHVSLGNAREIYAKNSEQTLESYEMCNLVEVFIARHDTLAEFMKTLECAYIYAKTVTMGPSHWKQTNDVLSRNRRLGCSLSGVAQFLATHSMDTLREWLNTGYTWLREIDATYSAKMGIPQSIKLTSIKPSGCVAMDTIVMTDRGNLPMWRIFNIAGAVAKFAGQWIYTDTGINVRNAYGEFEPITGLYVNGIAETYTIYTGTGIIKCTGDHKFLMSGLYDDGTRRQGNAHWVSAQNLRVNDCIPARILRIERSLQEEMTVDIEIGGAGGSHSYYIKCGDDFVVSHNSVSLLANATPGIHYPVSRYYIRRIMLAAESPLVSVIRRAGYHVEKSAYSPASVVVEFPVDLGEGVRSNIDCTMREKLELAAFMQKYWSDNQISVTIDFSPEESHEIEAALNEFQHKLKSVSLFPRCTDSYAQLPYETITADKFAKMSVGLKKIEFNYKERDDSEVDALCDSETCAYKSSK